MNKKDLLILGIIIVSAAISCRNQKHEFYIEGDVIISGKIKDWKENNKSKTITVICNDVASGKQITLVERIQPEGTFKFEFEKYNTQDIWLEYENEMKTLFIHPGDSIFIGFHKDGFSYSDDFSGDAEKVNRDIQAFFKEFSAFQNDDLTKKIKELSPLDYKMMVYNQQRQYDSLLSAFVNVVKPTNEIKLWVNTYLDYRCAFDLTQYMFICLDLSEEYWGFINDYPVDNPDAVICSEYLAYLEMYNAYLGLVQNKFDQIEDLYAQKRYYHLLATYTDSLVNTTTGTAFDILLTQFYYSIAGEDFTVVDSLFNLYDGLMHNVVLKNQLRKEILRLEVAEKSKNLASNITLSDLQNEDLIGELFSHIISKHRGKVLYVDFWAPWCSPCMEEIPYSQILHEDYKDMQIAFIYLCSQSSSENWKAIISEKNIEGEHYYLNNDQYSILQSQFKIQGIPWYLLINEEGEVVDSNAPRPSSEEIRSLLDEWVTNKP